MGYFTCIECGNTKPVTLGSTTGYGTDKEGNKVCFACCGIQDARTMCKEGRITLYLVDSDTRVDNWPSSLSFPVARVRKGRHNIARTRTDVWFKGPDGRDWHGVQYGDWSQLLHCRRLSA